MALFSSGTPSGHHRSLTLTVLTPSWLSAICCLVLATICVAAVAGSTRYQGSAWERYVTDWNLSAKYQTVNDPFHAADINNSVSTTVDTAFTLLFWMALGLIIYILLFSIIRFIGSLHELKAQLDYINLNRRQLIRQTLLQLTARLEASIALWLMVSLFFGTISRYAVGVTIGASAHLLTLTGIGRLTGALALFAASFHIMVVLCRLIALRPRLFGDLPSGA